ncbi:MAG: class I SAM-dependent methyltransferase [Lachnospiraceae bacterium]
MELSKRLMALVQLAGSGNVAADVGCDHGYVSIYLAQKELFSKMIAMDIRSGPLESAKRNIEIYQVSHRVETRLSDGAQALSENEADTLICAGMGGELVIHILEQDWKKIRQMKKLILQPQSEIHKVRRYLRENGFRIQDEDMVFEDGKYYPMMRAIPDSDMERAAHANASGMQMMEQTVGTEEVGVKEQMGRTGSEERGTKAQIQLEDWYGPCLLKKNHPVLKQYLFHEKHVVSQILKQLDVQLGKTKNEEGSAGFIRLLDRKERMVQKAKMLEEALIIMQNPASV